MIMNQNNVVDKLFSEFFANHKHTVCGIEIGTKCADLTRHILWAVPNSQVYTIDPWKHFDGAEFEAGQPQPYHDKNKMHAYQRLMAPEFENRVVILEMTSKDAHKWIVDNNPDKLFDFVWIDGDHSKEGIKTDLDLYEGMVKPGGLFGGHDYGLAHPLTEIIKERYNGKLQEGADFTWWIYK
jgi:hypothetical protein